MQDYECFYTFTQKYISVKKTLLLLLLFMAGWLHINAQESYWQASARIGLDFPSYQEEFKYIDYKKIGIIGGLSLNKYWRNWGIELDGDYIKNSPEASITNAGYTGIPTVPVPTLFTDFDVHKKDITRIFAGIGPAYKFETWNSKFSAEISLMGGLGIVDGGEILVQATDNENSYTALANYHSGFDKFSVFTGKAQVRTNFWLSDAFGLQIGAYYMHHFGGAEESQKNTILQENGYGSGTYFSQANSAETDDVDIFNGTYTTRTFSSALDENEKMKISSFGVFFGLAYKFGTASGIGSSRSYGYNSLEVAAIDEYSGQYIPKAKVFLRDRKGKIIKSGYTNDKGIITFNNLKANDYTVTAQYATFSFEDLPVYKSQFHNSVLKKQILYTDRSFILTGRTLKCNSSIALPGVSLFLENEDGSFKESVLSDNYGVFSIKLPESSSYKLYGKKSKFFSDVQEIVAENYDRSKTLFVNLEICATETKCGESIVLNNINYDLDKYFIREDAKPELDKIVRFLKDNPNVNIILKSHTDSRASNEYNLTLSQNRAQAAVNYITSKGISIKRITAKGYGETQLLNKCSDGVPCSEAEHQLNRRTEFEVVCPK